MKNLSDQVLWNALKMGDMDAFSVLFKTYYPQLHSYGLKITNNDIALTEDCLQDFFIYIYEHRDNLADLQTLKPYLYTSFRRAIFNALKKASKSITHEDVRHGEISFSKEDFMVQQEISFLKKESVSKLLNELPYRQKEVLFLKYYSNLKVAEISEVMDINYQSVLNMMHKAIKKMRQSTSLKKLLKEII